MSATVCTLFEGDYHYGVGALVNSLYLNGFRGIVWVGYRGALPPWAQRLNHMGDSLEYEVATGCSIRFVSVATGYHLTNYKPHFMRRLWAEHCPEADALFYFDPDIVIKCRWSFYEEWVTYGVALCEDVNSPLPVGHPLRVAWQRWGERYSIGLRSRDGTYFNGGLIGVTREMQRFLDEWLKIMELIGAEISGLEKPRVGDRTFLFCIPDQDALNIAVMCSDVPISPLGQEGMDFKFGGSTMSHAIGPAKPWRKSMIGNALRGRRPGLADKNYWRYTEEPIRLYSKVELLRKRTALLIASGIGRYFS